MCYSKSRLYVGRVGRRQVCQDQFKGGVCMRSESSATSSCFLCLAGVPPADAQRTSQVSGLVQKTAALEIATGLQPPGERQRLSGLSLWGTFFSSHDMLVDDLFGQVEMDVWEVCLLKCRRSAFQVG